MRDRIKLLITVQWLKTIVSILMLNGFLITAASAQGSCFKINLETAPICANVTIDRLIVLDNGNIYISTSGDENYLALNNGCTPSYGYVTLHKNVGARDRILALLITAHERRRPLEFLRFKKSNSDTSDACEIHYIRSEM